tara:strand:+ start:10092 stop:10421 length:330 start_codon:yes stop_codon:yes gene_type:complete
MNTYEVLLQRDNGINKTVIINDCYHEDEARQTAEAMYGMPVLRVLWKGETNSGQSTAQYPTTRTGVFSSLSALPLIIGFLFLVLLSQIWLPLLIIGAILALLAWYGSIE